MEKSYTILYIDDDEDDLQIIIEAFKKYADNLNILHAQNGQEGLKLLNTMCEEGKLPCMIILDINMPIMDGKQTLVKIRNDENYDEIPVVVFSTSVNPKDRDYVELLGADFITKPAKYLNLETVVKEFVEKCKLVTSLRT